VTKRKRLKKIRKISVREDWKYENLAEIGEVTKRKGFEENPKILIREY
jgi:hypothetical protein